MPSFLEAEINLDLGHVILLLVLIGFVGYLIWKARKEGLQPLIPRKTHCPDCAQAVWEKAKNGYLYAATPTLTTFPIPRKNAIIHIE